MLEISGQFCKLTAWFGLGAEKNDGKEIDQRWDWEGKKGAEIEIIAEIEKITGGTGMEGWVVCWQGAEKGQEL